MGSEIGRPHHKNLLSRGIHKQCKDRGKLFKAASKRTSQERKLHESSGKTASNEHAEKVVHPVLSAADHSTARKSAATAEALRGSRWPSPQHAQDDPQ